MNRIIDLYFPFNPSSVSVKIIHDLLFIEACEVYGIKGVDYTKHFFKTCKKVEYANSVPIKAFYKRGKIRIVTQHEKKRGETEILINITRAKTKIAEKFLGSKSSITCEEFRESLRKMGMIM
jgi:hypothetical protein